MRIHDDQPWLGGSERPRVEHVFASVYDMQPQLIPVRSTNVAAIGYDPTSSELYVKFHNGALYCY